MDTNQSQSKDSDLVVLARRLGRSRGGQVFGAAVTLVFFLGLAYYYSRRRDLAADTLIFGLAVYGATVVWRILPISASTRARWANERELASEAWMWEPCQYRLHFSLGAVFLIGDLLMHGIGADLNRSDFTASCIFFIYGAVSFLVFRRSVRNNAGAGSERSS